jgi:hypothetical protein
MNTIKKFNEPDYPKYKKIANYLLYVFLPFAQTSIAGAVVVEVLTTKQAFWCGLAISFSIVNLKLASKFITKR